MAKARRIRITGKRVDGPISKYINRKISSKITEYILIKGVSVTPNQISVFSFLIAVLSLPFYFLGGYLIIIGGLLAQLSSIIDGVDGELARALNMSSKRGAFFDAILDRYADMIILLGFSICLYKHFPHLIWLILTFLVLSGDVFVSYLHLRSTHDLKIHPASIKEMNSVASRDVRIFIVFVGSVFGAFHYLAILFTFIFLAILTHTYVIVKLFLLLETSRDREVGGEVV